MLRSSELLTLKQRLSRRLRGFRQERRLGVDTLAVILGIPVERMRSYESGQRLPPLLTLIRLAEKFEIGLDVLVFEQPKKAPLTGQVLLERFREISSLPQEDQVAVAELLGAIVQSIRKIRDSSS